MAIAHATRRPPGSGSRQRKRQRQRASRAKNDEEDACIAAEIGLQMEVGARKCALSLQRCGKGDGSGNAYCCYGARAKGRGARRGKRGSPVLVPTRGRKDLR